VDGMSDFFVTDLHGFLYLISCPLLHVF